MQDFEKLGCRSISDVPTTLRTKKPKDGLLLYDSKDLVTHAVCVGMTGSGKTGLCMALLEEAAIDGIPAIVIDPKGDLANLLLTFPGSKTRRLCAMGQRRRRAKERSFNFRLCGAASRDLGKGSRGLGTGSRAHQAPARCGRVSRLHARQQRRHSSFRAQVVCCSAAGDSRR